MAPCLIRHVAAAFALLCITSHLCATVRAADPDPGFLTDVIVGVIERTKISKIDVGLTDASLPGGVNLPITTDHLLVDLYKLNSTTIAIIPQLTAKEQHFDVNLNMTEISMDITLRPDIIPFDIKLSRTGNDTMSVAMQSETMELHVEMESDDFSMSGSMNAHRVAVDVMMISKEDSLSLHIESLGIEGAAGWMLLIIGYMVQTVMCVTAGYHYLKMRRAIRIMHEIERPIDSFVICSECGSKNVPGSRFCGLCGCAAVERSSAPSPMGVRPAALLGD